MEDNILDLKESTKYRLHDSLYFVIYDYDIRLFTHKKGEPDKGRRLIDINTYPHNPYGVIGKYFNFSK